VTGFHQWPAGASGPFSEKASHLAAASQYSFRVCGQDDNDSEETCGQTRTFTTKAAVEDAVYGGWWAGCCASFGVDARSGPSGENPRGSMNMRGFNQVNGHSIRFTGIVTCLKVDGATAIVGAVGDRNETPPDTTQRVSALVQIVDGRQQEDQYSSQAGFGGPTAPDCDSASFSSHTTLDTRHELIVNDAAPQP
jgi:hypothetical protein